MLKKNWIKNLVKLLFDRKFVFSKVLIIVLIFSLNSKKVKANQIVQDRYGNYYLKKNDGSLIKLPPPKPGNRYTLKKINKIDKIDKNDNNSFLNFLTNKKKRKSTRSANKIITKRNF